MDTPWNAIAAWITGNPAPRWPAFLPPTLDMLSATLAAVVVYFAAKLIVPRTLNWFVKRSKTQVDDIIFTKRVPERLCLLAPFIVIRELTPMALVDYPALSDFINDLNTIFILGVGLLILDALLNSLLTIYDQHDFSRELPLKSFAQITKIIAFLVCVILAISVLLDKTPLYLLSGIGAMTAVLMLIFKDAILGFVAGIQLSANRMIAKGDWISMPQYGADGDVLEVALTTVKVRNWDKTITTIPTYALISESFVNWRGMFETGGRRVKRAVKIDMNTITFCDEEMLRRFTKIQHISEYVERKKQEIAEYNQEMKVDISSLVNGRRMTNIGVFRAYVAAYLRNHPKIHQEMTFLVRQLEPGPDGLPIEIYVFVNDTTWANYEGVQADIFDHILAVIPEFDLAVFQNPTGRDFRGLRGAS